ncbi:hypothetical protein OQA88_12709 [Cercophora sp. LCS_1]
MNICAQEIFTSLVSSMAAQEGAKDIHFEIIGNPTNGKLVSEAFESVSRSFVSQELGTRADAVLCLLSALGKRVRVQPTKENVTDIVANYFSTTEWRKEEPALSNCYEPKVPDSEIFFKRVVRGALEFYRRSIQENPGGDFGANGSKWVAETCNRLGPKGSVEQLTKPYYVGIPRPSFQSLVEIVNEDGESGGRFLGQLCGGWVFGSDEKHKQTLRDALFKFLKNGKDNWWGCETSAALAIIQIIASSDLRSILHDSPDGQDRTALSYAAENAHIEVVKKLIKEGASAVSQDRERNTPLMWAVMGDGREDYQVGVVVELQLGVAMQALESGSKFTNEELTEFRETIRKNLESRSGDDFDRGWSGETDKEGAMQTVSVSLKKASKMANNWRRTALHCAAKKGSKRLTKQFFHDSSRCSTDVYQNTPLILAAESGHTDAVRILLEDREPINYQDWNWQSSLSLACGNGHEETARMLIDEMSPEAIDNEDNHGQTPLSYASESGHVGIVKMLLKVPGVRLNSVSQSGMTPLMYAARACREEVVKVLLNPPPTKEKAVVDSENRLGYSAMCHAIAYNDGKKSPTGIITLLRKEGASVPRQDKEYYGKALWECASANTRSHLQELGYWKSEPERGEEANQVSQEQTAQAAPVEAREVSDDTQSQNHPLPDEDTESENPPASVEE